MTWILYIILVSHSSVRPIAISTQDFVGKDACEAAAKMLTESINPDGMNVIIRCVKK